jgi:type 1 fimbria pilin
MRKRIALLLTALMLALTMSFGAAGAAFAAKTGTFSKGTCTVKAGQGGGSGSIKDQHHGQCGSQGNDV